MYVYIIKNNFPFFFWRFVQCTSNPDPHSFLMAVSRFAKKMRVRIRPINKGILIMILISVFLYKFAYFAVNTVSPRSLVNRHLKIDKTSRAFVLFVAQSIHLQLWKIHFLICTYWSGILRPSTSRDSPSAACSARRSSRPGTPSGNTWPPTVGGCEGCVHGSGTPWILGSTDRDI